MNGAHPIAGPRDTRAPETPGSRSPARRRIRWPSARREIEFHYGKWTLTLEKTGHCFAKEVARGSRRDHDARFVHPAPQRRLKRLELSDFLPTAGLTHPSSVRIAREE